MKKESLTKKVVEIRQRSTNDDGWKDTIGDIPEKEVYEVVEYQVRKSLQGC